MTNNESINRWLNEIEPAAKFYAGHTVQEGVKPIVNHFLSGAAHAQRYYTKLLKKVYAYLVMYPDFREHYPEFDDFMEKLESGEL